MTQITEIRVLIGDGIKKNEDYTPPRKAEVELKAAIAEGADAEKALDYLRKLADNKVNEILGRAPKKSEPAVGQAQGGSPPLPAQTPPTAEPASDTAAKEAYAVKANGPAEPIVEKPKRGRPPKVQAAAEPEKPAADPIFGDAETAPVEEVKAVPEITDVTLNQKCQAKAKAKAGTTEHAAAISAVHKLIAKYAGPPPANLRMIPKEKRQAFLDELDAIP